MSPLPHYLEVEQVQWQRLSAPNLVQADNHDFVVTFRRPCCRKSFSGIASVRSQTDMQITTPDEMLEYVYVLVEGTSIPVLEEFSDILKHIIDERIAHDQSYYNIEVNVPQYINHYVINGSSSQCRHGKHG